MTEPDDAISTDPQFCDDCNQVVRLEKATNGDYYLRCACPEQVRVPKTWRGGSWD